MSEFRVTTGDLIRSASDIEQIRSCLDEIRRQMNIVAGSNVLAEQTSLALVANSLRGVAENVGNQTVSLNNIQSALQEIARMYEDVERHLAGTAPAETFSSEMPSVWENIQQKIRDMVKYVRDYLKGALDKICMFAGDPVNMSNGNYFLETRDLMVKGFTPIFWERNYNGMEHSMSSLGTGWRHNHQWQISNSEEGWVLTEPDGSVLIFGESEKGAGEDEFEALSGEPCRLFVKEEWLEVIREGETYIFDLDGRILERKQYPGGRIYYRYHGERLTELVGEYGTELRLIYDSTGLLTDVLASDGAHVHYEYSEGRLVKVQSVGASSEYGYDETGRLIEIRGADGKTQLHNIYDTRDRVKEQRLGDGENLKYEYLKDRTILTWPDGTKVTYVFDSAFRHIRTVYHDSEERCTYNSRNQKTSFTDRLGRTTRYGYDPKGNLTFVIDPAGNRTSITYDSRGQVTAIKRPDGGRTVWRYTSDGLVSERKDANGGITRYSYNDRKLPEMVVFQDGTQMKMAYDAKGNLISCDVDGVRAVSAEYDDCNRRILERDGEGNTWRYAYDDAGRIISVTNPRGNRQHYGYDRNGRVSRHTDYAGNVSSCEYNDSGKPVLQVDVCGNVTELLYDERQNLKEKRLPGGGVFAYTYDTDNRLSKVLRDGEIYRAYEYDAVGNLIRERDALEHETSYVYDVCDRVIRIRRADGTERSFAYDTCGRMIRETDYQGAETLYEYDLEGNMTARTDPVSGRTEWQYNAGGLAEKITEASGRETRIQYGSCGRVKSLEIAGGRFEEYAYDACGRLVKESHSDGYEKTYTYDSCGNLIGIRDRSGSCRTARFDAMGRVTEVTDPRGNSTIYTYRQDGILTGILDPAGSCTSYQYSPEGYLEKLVRKGSAFNAETGRMEEQEHLTVYERDHFGRLLSETDPLGKKISYTYDELDRVVSRTDRMGRKTLIEYDLAGNMSELVFADGETARMYYTSGQKLTGVEETAGRMQIERDTSGRNVQLIDFDEMKTLFSYTRQGRLDAIHYPDNTQVQYRYDRYGRPERMSCGSLALSFAYDEAGRLVSRSDEKGSGTAWEYGPNGNILKISFLQNGETFKTCSYAYDSCGNKIEMNWQHTGIPEQCSHNSYVYDALNRISEVYEEGTRVRRYTYDGFGNRICLEEKGEITEYQYNEANQLIYSRHKKEREDVWRRTEYQYDPNGNQICVSGPDGILVNRYDCRNHPVAADTGTMSVRRLYSCSGQLLATARWNRETNISKECPTFAESVFNSGNVFALDGKSLESAGISRTHYFNDYGASADRNSLLGVRQPDGSLIKYLQDPFGMRVAWMEDDGSPRLLWTDEQGSVYAAAGKDGQIAEADRYDEFGNMPDLMKGYMPEKSGLSERVLPGFAGLMSDPVRGMYIAGTRHYDPMTGRFTEEDPMMRETFGVQDQNLYTYCFHQPMTLVDSDGCFPSLSDMYRGLSDFGNGVKDTWDRGVSTANDAWNWGSSMVKNTWNRGVSYVQHLKERASTLYRLYTDPEYHYNRNQYNDTPSDITTVFEYDENGQPRGKNGWELLPKSANKYHVNKEGEQGTEAVYNKKFVKLNPDGSSSEAIICFPPSGNPYLVDDYLNGGTFNFYNPGGWFNGNIPHFLFDMMPYYMYGNQREDGGWRKKVEDGIDVIRQRFAPKRNRQVMCLR